MKRSILTMLALLLTVFTAAGCGKSADKPAPVAISEGVDKCEVCNMMIADDQHATQLILKDGKALKFDDIGDLFAWRTKNNMDQVEVTYVRDYHSLEWVELENAYYLYDESFITPMSYGVYSFIDKAAAEAFAKEKGVGALMSAEELESHKWERSSSMGSGHGSSMEHSDGHSQDSSEHGHN